MSPVPCPECGSAWCMARSPRPDVCMTLNRFRREPRQDTVNSPPEGTRKRVAGGRSK